MKIMISNLSNAVTKDDVRKLFNNSDIDVTQIRSVVQGRTGKLITYAHLSVDDRAVGEQLIDALHNREIEENVISVKEYK